MVSDGSKEVVLSGIRATGKLHLGNYFGALRYFVELSKDERKKCFFFVANLHTLTTKTNPNDIKRDLCEIVLDFVSVGVDPERDNIFAQSSVPETCELAWMLNCLTSIAALERMPHFKEKKSKKVALGEFINVGLLTYPALMAADILGPRANIVPVGEDQHPHIELTKELARRFNAMFGETFPIPQMLENEAIRIPGLDGTGKMGKSDKNTIDLSDTPEIVKRKFAQAVTDPNRKRRSDSGDPSKCNIYAFHSLVSSDEEIGSICRGCVAGNIGCIDCKEVVSKNVNNILAPIQQRRVGLNQKGPDYALEILKEGGIRARKVISETVALAKDRMGIPSY